MSIFESIFEPLASAIGEFVAYLAGKILQRTFELEPKTAQTLGEYCVMAVLVGALVVVTVIYS